MPETGSKLFPAINNALYFGTNPKHEEVDFARSDPHQVPNISTPETKVLQGSQNLFWLVEGTKHLAGDYTGGSALLAHCERERNSLGDWGSEQDSPIYWGFHVAGRVAVASKTPNNNLRNACIQSIASFLKRAIDSLNDRTVLLAGMRGAGHPENSSYELDYIINQLHGDKTLKPKRNWNKRDPAHDNGINNYGWMLPQSSHTWRVLKEAYDLSQTFQFKANFVRIKKHILTHGEFKAVWIERDINGNTPAIMASFSGEQPKGISTLPSNFSTHIRQEQSHGVINFQAHKPLNEYIFNWTYGGIYNDYLPATDGWRNSITIKSVAPPSSYIVYGPDGREDKLNSLLNTIGGDLSPENPQWQPTPPVNQNPKPEYRSFIQRLVDSLRRLF